jgi:FkbM family methyltransferase
MKLIRLGSDYGGWHMVDTGSLSGSVLVSGGLGEDATFDLEFIKRFGAVALAVDPTPKAILHYYQIARAFGQAKTASYSRSGKQPIEGYDLHKVDGRNFSLAPLALWSSSGLLEFIPPANPNYVSGRLAATYSSQTLTQSGGSYTVVSSTLKDLIHAYSLPTPSVIKLDIEGAGNSVLRHMCSEQIFPEQILVELEELSFRDSAYAAEAAELRQFLWDYGYELVAREGLNHSFFRIRDVLPDLVPVGSRD